MILFIKTPFFGGYVEKNSSRELVFNAHKMVSLLYRISKTEVRCLGLHDIFFFVFLITTVIPLLLMFVVDKSSNADDGT
jgi:hypothetical protein